MAASKDEQASMIKKNEELTALNKEVEEALV